MANGGLKTKATVQGAALRYPRGVPCFLIDRYTTFLTQAVQH